MYNQLTLKSVVITMLYSVVILIVYLMIAAIKYKDDKQLRKMFIVGLLLKLTMGIVWGLLYEFYYNWEGDTFYYFRNANRLAQTFWESPLSYFKILFDMVTPENIASIDTSFYSPSFYWKNPSGLYAIHRFVSVFALIGFENYYVISILMNAFLYLIIWKVFRFIDCLCPQKRKIIFISFMCIPSVLLFSSGIMKDSFTFAFAGLLLVYLYELIVKKRFSINVFFYIIFSFYVVYSLKPYLLYAFLISFMLWFALMNLYKVKNKIFRVLIFPAMLLILSVSILYLVNTLGGILGGKYTNINTLVESAAASQYDLKQEYYQGNSFDIGDYNDIEGAISLAPIAILSGLFRPFPWEINSILVAFSALENSILIFLLMYIFFIVGIKKTIYYTKENLFILFCFGLALLMSFGVGISTSNFGALVRFKISYLPYFVLGLLYIIHEYKLQKHNTKQS